jgi:uncharacterized protein (DUF924 family)
MFQDVLRFWFEETAPKQWWLADPVFDELITRRFQQLHRQTVQGEMADWRRHAPGRLAEIIILDQLSRNIYRHTPTAFAQDPVALALSQEAIASGVICELTPLERSFIYMPFMHSESRKIHEQAERLFHVNGLQGNYDFELKHKAIIDRFGRYPHRNEILGRISTAEELEFLKQPGSGF